VRQKEQNKAAFDELLAQLPESQREVLTLLKVEGLSVEEVALATASTVGAVKQKAHRAYERLRKFLEEHIGRPAAAERDTR
jgi:RNA polymerase sigma-70 factor, ECF subfamily